MCKISFGNGLRERGRPGKACKKIGFIPRLINSIIECPFGLGGARFRRSDYEGYVDSVWPGFFWKKISDEIGLFEEKFVRTEDVEFNLRLREKGYKVYLTPKIEAYYFARDDFWGFLIQNINNGYGVAQTLTVGRKITAIRHFIPFIFVFSLALLGVLSFFSGIAQFLLIFEFGLYFLVDLFFSIQISLKNELKYLLVLPFMFLFLHLSYGIGTLFGILNLSWLKK